jgi:pyruvate,water dikinase
VTGAAVFPSFVLVPGGEPAPASVVGGKARNLALLADAGIGVPPWIVITAAVFDRLVVDGASPQTDPDTVRTRVQSMELPAEFHAEVTGALDSAGLSGSLLAVRSSAVDEDGAEASFAGQFDTVLGVRADGDALWDAIRRVWASAFSAHAVAYRNRHGGAPPRMAVLIQAMVDAEAAGVAFSADPVHGDPSTAVVSAVYGLGEGLVSGDLDADTYRVPFTGDEAGPVQAQVAEKDRAVRLEPDGGSRMVEVAPGLRARPALSEDEARRIATAARRLADHFGAPQDVEWALPARGDGGERPLCILQTRPITTLGEPAPEPPRSVTPVADGEVRLWDNSNIVESYSGVTTPLTFSFARSVYEQVYLQFCRLLGVSEHLLDEHRHTFANMLGLIGGRVYYNLLNWYRVLALLPGYTVNREFMERMMGVHEKLSDPPTVATVAGKWEDTGRTVKMAWRLIAAQRSLKREVPAFHARVDAALNPLAGVDLSTRPADELAAIYRDLEGKLLRHWRAPLVNDFFAMIFFGVLVRLVEKWLPGSPPTLANDLLVGEGGIISTEPAKRVLAMAERVAADSALSAVFAAEGDDERLWRRLGSESAFAPFHGEVRAYLDQFGDRCANELKLETLTHGDDPSFIVRLIRTYAQAGTRQDSGHHEAEVRAAAEATVRQRLGGVRQRVFFAVLNQARTRIRDRENLRFERTRVFGAVRRIFLGIGARLAETGRLDDGRDVLYLRVDEIFAHLDGTGVTADLRSLAKLRHAEFAAYERAPGPPDRFETRGPAADYVAALVPPVAPSGELRGTGCSPGVVRAPVRIVRDPHHAGELAGHILVAERTDPGWTLIFPAVEGVLVQRGSLLSHSAIVARELALPCIVGIPGLMETLRDGEMVEMDGTAGTLRRLDGAEG